MSFNHEITVFVHSSGARETEGCKASVEALHVPNGYHLSYVEWGWTPGPEQTIGKIYWNLCLKFPARYRIFLDEHLCFVREDFVDWMLQTFQADPDIGAIGISGIRMRAAADGSHDRVGGWYGIEQGAPVEHVFHAGWGDGTVADVHQVDGMMLATQCDRPWPEHEIDVQGALADASRSFRARGYRVVVPVQEHPWCLYTGDAPASKLPEAQEADAPLLTIGIPTYNRCQYLRKSLHTLCTAFADDPAVELLVSDNASTDATPEILAAYQRKCPGLRCVRQKENIGGDGNFTYLRTHARGRYVITPGDDDYLDTDTLQEVLKIIQSQPDISIIGLMQEDGPCRVVRGAGIDEYVQIISYMNTFITAIIYRREYLQDLSVSARWAGSSLRQVAWQMELLRKHPSFVAIFGPRCIEGSGDAISLLPEQWDAYAKEHGFPDFGTIIIGEYFDILEAYRPYGLTDETLHEEKEKLLQMLIKPWCRVIQSKTVRWQFGHVLEMYDRWYQDEPYYEKERKELEALVQENRFEESFLN